MIAEAQERSTEGNWQSAAICIATSLGIFGLFFVETVAPTITKLEHWTADWRTALLSDYHQTTHPKLAIVQITSETLEPYPFFLPIDRGLQADIIRAVDRAGAKAIALDFYYTKPTLPGPDEKLVQALSSARAKIILGAYENPQAFSQTRLKYQYDFIEHVKATAGYLNLKPDADGVVRSRANAPTGVRYKKSFSELIAEAAGRSQTAVTERISWLLQPTDGSDAFLKIPAHRLLDGTASASTLKNRVVIIAGAFPYFDRYRTPLSILHKGDMTGAEVHAQMAAELIDGRRSRTELDLEQRTGFLAGLAIFGLFLGWRFRQRKFDFLDWRVASFLVLAADAVLFKFAHIVLPFTLAAFAWAMSVTLGTQLRSAMNWFALKYRERTSNLSL